MKTQTSQAGWGIRVVGNSPYLACAFFRLRSCCESACLHGQRPVPAVIVPYSELRRLRRIEKLYKKGQTAA